MCKAVAVSIAYTAVYIKYQSVFATHGVDLLKYKAEFKTNKAVSY